MRQAVVRVNDGDEFALSQQLHALQKVRSCVATDLSLSVAAQVLLECCVTCVTRVEGNKLASGKAAQALRRAVPYVAMVLRVLWSCMPCVSGRDDNETIYEHRCCLPCCQRVLRMEAERRRRTSLSAPAL